MDWSLTLTIALGVGFGLCGFGVVIVLGVTCWDYVVHTRPTRVRESVESARRLIFENRVQNLENRLDQIDTSLETVRDLMIANADGLQALIPGGTVGQQESEPQTSIQATNRYERLRDNSDHWR